MPTGELSRWRRARDRARSYWLLLPISAAALALLLLDLLGIGSRFWEANPLVANLASEAVVAVALIYGVDRVLKARAARLWRPFGVRIAQELDVAAGLHEILEQETLAYCERAYQKYELPEGRTYPGGILIEALGDPLTWAGLDDLPDPLTRVVEGQQRLEERFTRWAAVLIAEPNLASIAARTSELIEVNHHIVLALEDFQPGARALMPPDLVIWSFKHFGGVLLGCLIESEQLSFELKREVTLYVTGQPLEIGPAAMPPR